MNDIDIFLKADIERRVLYEKLAKEYTLTKQTVKVTSANFFINCTNRIFYLVNKVLDMPPLANLKISATDHFLCTSKATYESSNSQQNNSFSDYMRIETTNYGTTFIPFNLEFLIVNVKK